jgi:hypothetical protein
LWFASLFICKAGLFVHLHDRLWLHAGHASQHGTTFYLENKVPARLFPGILFTASLDGVHPGWRLKGLYGTWRPAQWFDVYYTVVDVFVFLCDDFRAGDQWQGDGDVPVSTCDRGHQEDQSRSHHLLHTTYTHHEWVKALSMFQMKSIGQRGRHT